MMPIAQRVERAGGGLIHTREPWNASAFAEPQVETLCIVPWGPDALRVRVTEGRVFSTPRGR